MNPSMLNATLLTTAPFAQWSSCVVVVVGNAP
ncbi:ilvB operon leader peptide IvbL [Salmonella enterica subsp. enterica]|nr:ilvB operon leader peptide IvbL [Salmonella enterica subsp. enterica]